MRVVIDTNVWVSALLTPRGYPARVVEAFRDGRFESVVSEPLLQEIQSVLSRPRIQRKYAVSEDEINNYLKLIRQQSLVVETPGVLNRCRDARDNFLLETAIWGKAQYLITRDDDLKRDPELIEAMQSRSVGILSVHQFLELLKKER